MSQLGSIFEPDPGTGPRGRDLRAEVTVPGASLGDPDGHPVAVPLELPALGGYATRAVSDFDHGETLQLRLPPDFPDGGTLRLRGQGESIADGRPGDLLLTVHVDGPRRTPPQGALTWSSGQAVARPPGSVDLVLVVAIVFAGGIALFFLI